MGNKNRKLPKLGHENKVKIERKKEDLKKEIDRAARHPFNRALALIYGSLSMLLLLSALWAGQPLLLIYLVLSIYISAVAYKKG